MTHPTCAVPRIPGGRGLTFNANVLNGNTGEASIVSENCAINVTSRAGSGFLDAIPAAFLVRTIGPNSVRVSASDVDVDQLINTGFDISASC